MKKLKPVVAAAMLTIMAFVAVLYSSCLPDRCSNVVCYNGGTCASRQCNCPSGFAGAHCEYSSLIYQNNTYTDIHITVSGSSTVIPVGTSVAYTGVPGDYITVDAYTQGAYGRTINWHFHDAFPTGIGQVVEPFDVSSDLFFLELQNFDHFTITGLYVNYALSAQSYEDLAIPPDGLLYGMGYYYAYDKTKVSVDFAPGGFYTSSRLSIPYVLNASYAVSIP